VLPHSKQAVAALYVYWTWAEAVLSGIVLGLRLRIKSRQTGNIALLYGVKST